MNFWFGKNAFRTMNIIKKTSFDKWPVLLIHQVVVKYSGNYMLKKTVN